jgi:hypothetical protein
MQAAALHALFPSTNCHAAALAKAAIAAPSLHLLLHMSAAQHTPLQQKVSSLISPLPLTGLPKSDHEKSAGYSRTQTTKQLLSESAGGSKPALIYKLLRTAIIAGCTLDNAPDTTTSGQQQQELKMLHSPRT